MKNSIEEDIKILETWLEELNELFNKNHINNTKERNALYNILSDYKRVLKENEEIRIKNNAIKRESEAYAEKMIRLDIEKQDYFEKYRYHLQQNESLTKEFGNVIPVQKVKDKIEKEELPLTIVGGRKNKKTLEYGIKLGRRQALQELIKEEEENHEENI